MVIGGALGEAVALEVDEVGLGQGQGFTRHYLVEKLVLHLILLSTLFGFDLNIVTILLLYLKRFISISSGEFVYQGSLWCVLKVKMIIANMPIFVCF